MHRKQLLVLVAFLLGTPIQADDSIDPKALVQKAIQAHGGAKALKKYVAAEQTIEGTVDVMGQELKLVGNWWVQHPGYMKNEMLITVGENQLSFVNVVAKDQGWISVNGMTQEMPMDMLESAQQEVHASNLSRLIPLLDTVNKLKSLGEKKIADKPAIGIRVSNKKYKDVDLYFDKKTNLLAQMEVEIKDFMQGGKMVKQALIFGDYKKDNAGLQQPTTVILKRGGETYLEGKVTKSKAMEKIDKSVFKEP